MIVTALRESHGNLRERTPKIVINSPGLSAIDPADPSIVQLQTISCTQMRMMRMNRMSHSVCTEPIEASFLPKCGSPFHVPVSKMLLSSSSRTGAMHCMHDSLTMLVRSKGRSKPNISSNTSSVAAAVQMSSVKSPSKICPPSLAQ